MPYVVSPDSRPPFASRPATSLPVQPRPEDTVQQTTYDPILETADLSAFRLLSPLRPCGARPRLGARPAQRSSADGTTG